MHQGIGRLTLVALPLWLAACASWPQTLYHWGNYPDTIHAWYDGNDDWVGQERALRKIMGLVLSRQGRDDEAKAEFAEEQALYPESATFMTRLQGRRMAASKPQDGRDMTSGKDNAAGGHAG